MRRSTFPQLRGMLRSWNPLSNLLMRAGNPVSVLGPAGFLAGQAGTGDPGPDRASCRGFLLGARLVAGRVRGGSCAPHPAGATRSRACGRRGRCEASRVREFRDQNYAQC